MQIEKHVASFELSMELKTLGFDQDCAFCWGKAPKDFGEKFIVLTNPKYGICAAPLSSELGYAIDKICCHWQQTNYIDENEVDSGYSFNLFHEDKELYLPSTETIQTEANVRSDVLIYLMEMKNKHAK